MSENLPETEKTIILDSASEVGESDASSIDGASFRRVQPNQLTRDQLIRELETMYTKSAQYKAEIDSYKLQCKNLREENKMWKKNNVEIQARLEQEEENISNTLMRKIQELKKDKEKISMEYEFEEECLTNELSRKLERVKKDKKELEENLIKEHSYHVGMLERHIRSLEAQATAKENALDKLRKDKIDLENVLEHEQEALVNKLCRRIDKLETEKINLMNRLSEQSMQLEHTEPKTNEPQSVDMLSSKYVNMRSELVNLRQKLHSQQNTNIEKVKRLSKEESQIRAHNQILKRKMGENEKIKRIIRFSESESSVDDECIRADLMNVSPKQIFYRHKREHDSDSFHKEFSKTSLSSTGIHEFKAPSFSHHSRESQEDSSPGAKSQK